MSTSLPLVSIITPSFNQGEYLEETIRSVASQDYPNLEYLVVDGASRDGSVDVIRRHKKDIHWWISEPDKGHADAFNKGLAVARGEIVGWLNSDDVYRPGAVRQAVDALREHPRAGLVYGDLDSIDRWGDVFNTITYKPYELPDLLAFRIIGQPAVFMRRALLDQVGGLDTAYRYLLDHHLWIRIARRAGMLYVPRVWAAARHHPEAKNVAQAAGFGQEVLRILDWAGEQKDLQMLIEQNRRMIEGGAQRLNARYLLDGGLPGLALKAYGRALANSPGYALQHWRRMLAALLGAVGLGGLVPRGRVDVERPILVTGLHRSGTTWVGRTLAMSGKLAYVSEPLNVYHRPGVMDAPVEHWYSYVCEENEAGIFPAIKETLRLRYKSGRELRSLRSPRDFLRMLRDWFIFWRGRWSGRRALLKDPFAVFSVEWFAARLACDVVIVVRHPAAFVSSLKRLGWNFDLRDLLAQPLLMRDWLQPFKAEIEAAAEDPKDLIAQGSLLWRLIVQVVHTLEKRHPEFQVVKHEELSREPVKGFETLYAALGLEFTARVRRGVERMTSSMNPGEVPLRSIYSTRLDSAANLDNWKQRLSAEEVARIRQLTEDVAAYYYDDEDWE